MKASLNIVRFLVLLFLVQNLNAQETWVFPFSYQDQWGIVDNNRQELVSPQFEKMELFMHSRSGGESALAWKNDRIGLINRKGEWIIAPKMDTIYSSTYKNDFLYNVEKKRQMGHYQHNRRCC